MEKWRKHCHLRSSSTPQVGGLLLIPNFVPIFSEVDQRLFLSQTVAVKSTVAMRTVVLVGLLVGLVQEADIRSPCLDSHEEEVQSHLSFPPFGTRRPTRPQGLATYHLVVVLLLWGMPRARWPCASILWSRSWRWLSSYGLCPQGHKLGRKRRCQEPIKFDS